MEEVIGMVKMFAGNFAPQGWALCDGTLLEISTNTALFSILGVQYGGDGVHNFALPNIEKTQSIGGEGINHVICIQGIYPSRS